MRKFVTLLAVLVSACSTQKVKAPQDSLQNQFKQISNTVVLTLDRPQTQAQLSLTGDASGATQGKLIALSAVTADPYLGWVKTSVGFAQGEISESALKGLGPDSLPYSWRVLKKWADGSVRIGQIKMLYYFGGTGVNPVNLVLGKTPKQYFEWNQNVWNAVLTNRFQTELKFQVIANGEALDCVPASGAYKFLVADTTEVVVRYRSHCVNRDTRAARPLSLTSYFTMFSGDPVVRIENILGNDTREFVVQGGIALSNIQVVSGNLPPVRWVNENAFQSKSTQLADGQSMAFKLVVALDPQFNSAARMIATGEPMGFQFYQDAQDSNAFGTAPLPTTRVPLSAINSVHSQIDAESSFPDAQPSTWVGLVDQSPGDTGAQSDFSSTAPLEIQKAMQAYSARKMASILLSVSRESYRPIHYWETRNGQEDWVKSTSYPELFCWGRCPHRDFSWNSQYQEWFPRTQNAGFNAGDSSGWNPDDNQHVSHNHLRYAYELTGNVVLEEWLKEQVSQVYWNYFTGWLPNVEAERAWGRTMKHAIALTDLFPDLPETALLKSRFARKIQVYSDAVTNTVSVFGNPAAVPFDACDPRVNNGIWCPIQDAFGHGPFIAVGWTQGFVNEAMTLIPNPDLRLLAAAETFFLSNGTLKTYFPLPIPNDYITGGIGVEWTAGWLQLALKYPNAPGAQFIIQNLKPVLEDRMQHGCVNGPYFCLNDSFRSFK